MRTAPGEDIGRSSATMTTIVEFEITNNRPDCYSLLGLARESAAAFNLPMHHHTTRYGQGRRGRRSARAAGCRGPGGGPVPPLHGAHGEKMSRSPSPKWMRQRLRGSGHPPHQQYRGHYQLCHAGIRPAHAFL